MRRIIGLATSGTLCNAECVAVLQLRTRERRATPDAAGRSPPPDAGENTPHPTCPPSGGGGGALLAAQSCQTSCDRRTCANRTPTRRLGGTTRRASAAPQPAAAMEAVILRPAQALLWLPQRLQVRVQPPPLPTAWPHEARGWAAAVGCSING